MAIQHFLSTTRWVISGVGMRLPQAFFLGRVAQRQAYRLMRATQKAVTVQRQVMVNGEWEGREEITIPYTGEGEMEAVAA